MCRFHKNGDKIYPDLLNKTIAPRQLLSPEQGLGIRLFNTIVNYWGYLGNELCGDVGVGGSVEGGSD